MITYGEVGSQGWLDGGGVPLLTPSVITSRVNKASPIDGTAEEEKGLPMPNKILLVASENKKLERIATKSSLTRPIVARYVAGTTLDEALDVTDQLNAVGIAVSLDLLGESVHDERQAQDATDTMPAALAALQLEIDFARLATAGMAMDALAMAVPTAQRIPGWQPSLRWILVHMIEEYARHCGPADLLRQAADGATGDSRTG